MQIACPSCKTKITVPDEKIKPEGTKVKCGKCSKIFTVKKKSSEKAAAPDKAAAPAPADEFSPAPAADAPAAAPAFDAASELGLGQSSAPVDEEYLGGDNFGAEMDNYRTQIRQVGGRDSSMFGSSADLDGKPSKRDDSSASLFGGDAPEAAKPRPKAAPAPAPASAPTPDLDSLFDEAPPAPANKPAAAMPPKESLDDLFGKGLDDPADDFADTLREAKPKKGRSQDIDALFDRGEPEPKPKSAGNAERDAFFNDEPAPPPPPPRREAPPAPRGPSAEELAATLKLEPALKEEDAPKAPAPKPAEPKPAAPKQRAFPAKAVAFGIVGLLVAGGVGAAIFVPAVNGPVMQVVAKYSGMFAAAKPEVAKAAPVSLTVTVTGSRPIVGGRGDKIFVIEGRVRNDYPGSRSFIKVRGTLTAADGTVIATRDVFAGNVLNDEEIRGLDRVKIDGILNRSVGGGLQNFNVPSGNEIPFQIVFYDVEQPVTSQQVEPVGSEPGS